jgi:hypothetical protein
MFDGGPWIALYETTRESQARAQFRASRQVLKRGQSLALLSGEKIVQEHHAPALQPE